MPGRDVSHYDAVARDIANVASDASEQPIWGDDVTRAKTAIVLTALAFFESRFWRFVDEGICNGRDSSRVRALGNCDGGYAYSLWQIHPEDGLVLVGDGWAHARDVRGVREVITGKMLIADRTLAARVALHIARRSIRAGAGLCQYTGELGPCPKGNTRLGFALRWVARHPFTQDP
jgi:hypothetical protein